MLYRWIVFDCEIIRAVPSKKEEPIEGIEYCRGWTDYAGMGISVAGVYDTADNRYRVFGEDNLTDLQALADSADLTIGFNSLRFDNPLLAAHGVILDPARHYDLKAEILKAADGIPKSAHQPHHTGFSLDALAEANLSLRKGSGSGAQAPILWQQGRRGKVIDDNLLDVHLTWRLVQRLLHAGTLLSPATLQPIFGIRRPAL